MFDGKDFNSIFDLMKAFPDEKSCMDYLACRWINGIVSPFDPTSKVYKCKGDRYKCKNTGKYFNARTGTIFERSNIELQKWFVAVFLFLSHKKGISSHQLAKDIDVTQKTAWFMIQRIRYGLHWDEKDMDQMTGTVELDETFVGGKNKNRHADKKVRNSQGRAFIDKTPVLGMLQEPEVEYIIRDNKVSKDLQVVEKVIKHPGEVRCRVVPDTKGESLQPIIHANVCPSATIISDEWYGYRGLEKFYTHKVVDHMRKEYVNAEGDTTNSLEGFWTWIKRAYTGVYHSMSRKHLQKYVDEAAFRYNARTMKAFGRMTKYIKTCGPSITFKQLVSG